MKPIAISVLTVAAIGLMAGSKNPPGKEAASIDKGIQWLISVQGRDGGWGQDGGETSHVRQGQHLMGAGNDPANTAVALLALAHAGHTPSGGAFAANSRRGVEFLLTHVEKSPAEGLAITDVKGTQIQMKLGPYIDTFLTSSLLSELDGRIQDPKLAQRVRSALQKCVHKIEKNQLQDGSWNISGGWAPVLGTSLASRSLDAARKKGVKVEAQTMARVEKYTRDNLAYATNKPGGPSGGRVRTEGVSSPTVTSSAAPPAPLYQAAQALEQLTRSDQARRQNEKDIKSVTEQLNDAAYVRGFGSMGGEEFFSYLNISESLKRSGGKPWTDWNARIKGTLLSLQNQDGTWAGHHCITGRVAVTSAALLTLTVERL